MKEMERVLLVDDEPDILELLRYNLEKEDYSVETAKNGEEALKLAGSFQPDLIVLPGTREYHQANPKRC